MTYETERKGKLGAVKEKRQGDLYRRKHGSYMTKTNELRSTIHYLYRLFLEGHWAAGANPSRHWARGELHPGLGASFPIQGRELIKNTVHCIF